MNFLLDSCAGTRLADWLRDNGHNVLEAQSIGADPGDEVLLEMAAASNRVLVTIDSDFGELIHLRHAAHAGLIRLPDVPAQRRIDLVSEVINRHRQALEQHALVTIRGDRIRVSHPPERGRQE